MNAFRSGSGPDETQLDLGFEIPIAIPGTCHLRTSITFNVRDGRQPQGTSTLNRMQTLGLRDLCLEVFCSLSSKTETPEYFGASVQIGRTTAGMLPGKLSDPSP